MRKYEFTLRFRLPLGTEHSDELIERLGNAGCDDALVGIGHAGRIALEFVREGYSARGAVLSAIADVKRAIPDADLVEASPDLAGVTDIAEAVGCSRQNMRKLLLSRGSHSPAPIHEGNAALWHLAPVLRWLTEEKHYVVSEELLELTDATMRVNAALSALQSDADTQRELHALLA